MILAKVTVDRVDSITKEKQLLNLFMIVKSYVDACGTVLEFGIDEYDGFDARTIGGRTRGVDGMFAEGG